MINPLLLLLARFFSYRLAAFGISVLMLVVAGLVLVNTCTEGGAMAATYRTCQCRGIEWKVYDRSAVDGPEHSICFGIVESRTCYLFIGGPEITCR